MSQREKNLSVVQKSLKSYPDFPKPGILFHDIFSILQNPVAARALYEIIEEDCSNLKGKCTAVCGLDARGFLFGPQIAQQLHLPFIPIRKKGKLPGETIREKFELEYGFDELEIQKSLQGGNVLLVDDLLATGGSLKAAGRLAERLGCKIELCFVIMEITSLKGRDNIPYPVHSILPC